MSSLLLLTGAAGMFLLWRLYSTRGMEYVRSALTGRSYYVKNLPDKQAAADCLARLERTLALLTAHLGTKHRGDERARRIVQRWDGTLSETDWQNAEEAAYSLDKGQVCLCVRTPRGAIEDHNTAVFVLLHELAHVATREVGHTPAFWRNFRWLLKVAKEEVAIYAHQRFETVPGSYCGKDIFTNPYTCVADKTCGVEEGLF